MRTLTTDTELLTAALAQIRVTVREQGGRIADYGGVVERYSPEFVRIAGVNYVREKFHFTTGTNLKPIFREGFA